MPTPKLRVFCLAIPHTTGALDPNGPVKYVQPIANGSIESVDHPGELLPFCVVDATFKDDSPGLGVTWMHPDPARRGSEILPLEDLTKTWVHGALSSQPDEKSFWSDVVEDLVNSVIDLSPFPHVPADDLARAFWDTLQQRLGICLTDAADHDHPHTYTRTRTRTRTKGAT